ncbi:MAG: serine hydrolase, partial [Cyclobacteriaceae bacterium]|nr:serine hydrolase [Cyclobacteriaceae bacterium]
LPLAIGGSVNHPGLSLPDPSIIASVTEQTLLEQLRQELYLGMEEQGLNFIMDPDIHQYSHLFGLENKPGLWRDKSAIPLLTTWDGQLVQPTHQHSGVLVTLDTVYREEKKIHYNNTPAGRLRLSGYEGLIITNIDQPIEGAEDIHPAEMAFLSGADIFLTEGNLHPAVDALTKGLKKKRLLMADLNRKCKSILQWKYQSLHPDRNIHSYDFPVSTSTFQNRLYRESVTLHKNRRDLLPLRALDTMTIASASFSEDFNVYSHMLSKYTAVQEFQGLLNNPVEVKRLKNFDVVIIGLEWSPNDKELTVLKELNKYSTVVLTLFYSPYNLGLYSDFDVVMSAHLKDSVMQSLVPQILFGALPVKGVCTDKPMPPGFSPGITYSEINRLQYTSPEEAGMDAFTLRQIDEIVSEAITNGATPGCQVFVARKGKIVFEKSFGHYTYHENTPVTDQTIYDLASLTKVMATLQAIMFLQERHVIDVGDKLSRYLPELRHTNKESIIIRDILLHQAGLKPFMPFWVATMDKEYPLPAYYSPFQEEEYPLQISNGMYAVESLRDSIWSWIIDSRLMKKRRNEPYTYRYSDMGFFMLQQLAERMLNQPLNEFVQQNFYDPLGMTTTSYLPLCRFPIERIAPTAVDDHFRKQLVYGLVHDEGAAMFGGVAGHAGLFSNAGDLAKLAHMLMSEGYYGGEQYFKSSTLNYFTAKQVKDNRRGLGWDKPNIGSWRTPTSEFASGKTFGHTGFTGTAVWVDPEFDLIYIFLSNRIHPDAENTKLMTLNIRSRIQDLIYKSIWNYEQYRDELNVKN